jgi:hypothetical protein
MQAPEQQSVIAKHRPLLPRHPAEGDPGGDSDGVLEGSSDGLPDGAFEGSSDGLPDGAFEGRSDGLPDGAFEGRSDGLPDGAFEGAADAFTVGASDAQPPLLGMTVVSEPPKEPPLMSVTPSKVTV